ncbi:MAG: phytoene desaturase family protein [Candidatus Cryptobacteroides sp.]
MRGNRAVIIGSGLGGLQCAFILAKCGMEVIVLERQANIGGCLQSFHRGGEAFDTGMHYVGALGEGESLNRLFSYYGLTSLPWVQLDRDCFDEVVIGEESFRHANGHEEFARVLADRFPHEKEGIYKYVGLLKETGDNIFGILSGDGRRDLSESPFARSAYGFLCECTENHLLRKVLSGSSLKMELKADTLPLYTFAQINDSFIRSAWRLKGSGSMIAESLAESIRKMGGTIRTKAEVTSIIEGPSGTTGVEVNGEEFIGADWVVSDAHPAVTVSLVPSGGKMRKAYRNRILSAENTGGMFTACLSLKKGVIPYFNRNIFIFNEDADMWNLPDNNVSGVMVSCPVPEKGEYAEKIDLLTPCRWDLVEKWYGTPVGRRGDDYVRLKQKMVRECIRMAQTRIPGLADAVDEVYSSTPLTYQSYNASPQGSAYGLRKDWNFPILSVLSPQTPVEGLLLTGQSLNLHGLLGVSMTSLLTCGAIVGMDKIREELKMIINI